MRDKFKILYDVLRKNREFTTEDGELKVNKISESAMKMDNNLIELLICNKETKQMFFKQVNGIYIFDKVQFSWIIDSNEFLPSCYTKFLQNIMLVDKKGNSIINNLNDVILSFPYKDCILQMDSTEDKDKRDEIMYNEILMKTEIDNVFKAPKVLCNALKYTQQGEKNINFFKNTDNLLIKGNNLLALYSLLPRYKGKIKLIYWDILYNTDSDHVPYEDSFKHSTWLLMMKNRLEIAKKLLKDEGVILVQCDKNEDAYLKVLMDEIFGRDNYINTICIKSSSLSGAKTSHKNKTILKTKDSLLVYKGNGIINIFPQYTRKDKWDTHYNQFLKKNYNGSLEVFKLKDVLIENRIINKNDTIRENYINNNKFMDFCIENKNNIFRYVNSIDKEAKQKSLNNPNEIIKYYNKNGEELLALNGSRCSFLSSTISKIDNKDMLVQLLGDLWTDIDFQNTQNEGNNSLPSGKKPEALIKRIINMFMCEGDIILDAYLGSGTTAAVAHKMNMKYIGIEQLDKHMEKSVSRLKSVIDGEQSGISKSMNWHGGGSFVYCELAKNSQAYVEKICSANNEELIQVYNELIKSDFILYRVDINKMARNIDEFNQLEYVDKVKLCLDVINKNTLYINYSEMNDSMYNLSENDKEFSISFYEVEE